MLFLLRSSYLPHPNRLPRWLSWLRHSAHQPGRPVAGAGVQFPGSSGKSRIAEVAERKIEVPKAPRGVGRGEGVSPPHWERGLGRGPCRAPSPEFFFDLELKMASFGAFWVAF